MVKNEFVQSFKWSIIAEDAPFKFIIPLLFMKFHSFSCNHHRKWLQMCSLYDSSLTYNSLMHFHLRNHSTYNSKLILLMTPTFFLKKSLTYVSKCICSKIEYCIVGISKTMCLHKKFNNLFKITITLYSES